ncbi:hypothetical protein HMPREF3205_00456 [Streptococcus pasteurianus]|nr:hypothetical protein HMPREF3205_00456 [Streptococcus pasteurianus]
MQIKLKFIKSSQQRLHLIFKECKILPSHVPSFLFSKISDFYIIQ